MTATKKVYCLDTSALLYLAYTYSTDIFPEVWEQLAALVANQGVIAPHEVRRELERKTDNGAFSWAKANAGLFRPLDADQSNIVGEIINSARFHGLIDHDAEMPDADPFVVALAVTCGAQSNFFEDSPAVVAVDAPGIRIGLGAFCKDSQYPIRFLTPYQMLLEMELDVPEPGGTGLSELYGIWERLEITEEDIAASKLKFRDIES